MFDNEQYKFNDHDICQCSDTFLYGLSINLSDNCFPGYSILFAVKCNKLYKTNITQGSVTVKYVLIIFRLCRILFTRWRVSTTSKNYIWQH
jgi:hypothetical protein